MRLIERSIYLDRIKSKRGTPDIKIITGIRRAGKSKLLLAYMDFLRETDSKANIIFIDFRLLEAEPLKEYHALNDYIESHYLNDRNNYICIDEIQMCKHFELAINSLHATEKYDIYLTGSNAFMLSSDLATLFTGRYIEIQVFPFSFKAYRTYFGEHDNIQKQFDNYVIEGGLAGSYLYEKSEDKTAYIHDVYNTILQRDLVEKYNLPDNTTLTRLVEYMMDNVSNISSPNNISENLIKNGISTNHVTISTYLELLKKAFVLYKIDRYDIRGKKYLQSLNKFYLADTSVRFAVLGHRNMDWGRMYENIVCIEFLRRGYELYVGKLYQKEIDFVAIKGSEKLYIQVSDDISNNETFEREYTPLLQIKDAYPKMIIARTRNPRYDYQGIEIVDLAEWLITS